MMPLKNMIRLWASSVHHCLSKKGFVTCDSAIAICQYKRLAIIEFYYENSCSLWKYLQRRNSFLAHQISQQIALHSVQRAARDFFKNCQSFLTVYIKYLSTMFLQQLLKFHLYRQDTKQQLLSFCSKWQNQSGFNNTM